LFVSVTHASHNFCLGASSEFPSSHGDERDGRAGGKNDNFVFKFGPDKAVSGVHNLAIVLGSPNSDLNAISSPKCSKVPDKPLSSNSPLSIKPSPPFVLGLSMSISFTFSFTLPTVDVPIALLELAPDLELDEEDEEAPALVDVGADTVVALVAEEDEDGEDPETVSSAGGIQFSGSRPSWMYTSLIIVAYSRPPPICAERISFARSASHLCFLKNAKALNSAAASKCVDPFFANRVDLTKER
jgi:hypothetical protein